VKQTFSVLVAISLCSIALFAGCQTMEPRFPLKEEPESIEKYVLRATPLGSGIRTAEQFCRDHRFEMCPVSRESGFRKQAVPGYPTIVGEMHARGFAGDYPMGEHFIVSTSVFWGFDKNEKLIEVWVWKTIDGP
jgi:hypothetical protein